MNYRIAHLTNRFEPVLVEGADALPRAGDDLDCGQLGLFQVVKVRHRVNVPAQSADWAISITPVVVVRD